MEDSCVPPGGVAGIVVATSIVTCALIGLATLLFHWHKRRRHQNNTSTGDERRSHFAFDNPHFRNCEDTVDKGKMKVVIDGKSSLRSSKVSTWEGRLFGRKHQRALDDACSAAPERRVVQLRGKDFTGLGFNICGNMRDGILVKDVLHRGPASESGLISAGDRIMSVTVSFGNMVYEDALTILSYASPYDVELEVEHSAPQRPQLEPSESFSTRLFHPLYRSQSIDDLTQIGKEFATGSLNERMLRHSSSSRRLNSQRLKRSSPPSSSNPSLSGSTRHSLRGGNAQGSSRTKTDLSTTCQVHASRHCDASANSTFPSRKGNSSRTVLQDRAERSSQMSGGWRDSASPSVRNSISSKVVLNDDSTEDHGSQVSGTWEIDDSALPSRRSISSRTVLEDNQEKTQAFRKKGAEPEQYSRKGTFSSRILPGDTSESYYASRNASRSSVAAAEPENMSASSSKSGLSTVCLDNQRASRKSVVSRAEIDSDEHSSSQKSADSKSSTEDIYISRKIDVSRSAADSCEHSRKISSSKLSSNDHTSSRKLMTDYEDYSHKNSKSSLEDIRNAAKRSDGSKVSTTDLEQERHFFTRKDASSKPKDINTSRNSASSTSRTQVSETESRHYCSHKNDPGSEKSAFRRSPEKRSRITESRDLNRTISQNQPVSNGRTKGEVSPAGGMFTQINPFQMASKQKLSNFRTHVYTGGPSYSHSNDFK